MKRLSMKAAQRCETACKPKCKCRCGGLLHGAKRGLNAEFFEALPEEDPHKAKQRREPKRRQIEVAPTLFDQEEVTTNSAP